MVVAVVGKAADQRHISSASLASCGMDFREVDSGQCSGDGSEGTANFLGCVRFRVEGNRCGTHLPPIQRKMTESAVAAAAFRGPAADHAAGTDAGSPH
jgi:hypothetical protein